LLRFLQFHVKSINYDDMNKSPAVIFDFEFCKEYSNTVKVRWTTPESESERILTIGLHLPKL